MKSVYKTNKERAIYRNSEPSMTDQSQAREADINVIVGRFINTGTVPGGSHDPMYGDFTNLPYDLREFLHVARGLDEHKKKLPAELRDLPVEQLIGLTAEQIVEKLKKPEPPADKTEGVTT